MKKIEIFLLGISMGIILSACRTERAENVESAETMEINGKIIFMVITLLHIYVKLKV